MILQAAMGVGIFLGVFLVLSFIFARLIVWIFQIIAWFVSGRRVSFSLYVEKQHTMWWMIAVMLVLMAVAIYQLKDYVFL